MSKSCPKCGLPMQHEGPLWHCEPCNFESPFVQKMDSQWELLRKYNKQTDRLKRIEPLARQMVEILNELY